MTEHPTAEWASQQIVEAFGDGKVPRFIIRGRNAVCGLTFRERAKAFGMEEVVIAPHGPWQSPEVGRVSKTLHREFLDHVVVLGEAHLRLQRGRGEDRPRGLVGPPAPHCRDAEPQMRFPPRRILRDGILEVGYGVARPGLGEE